MMLLHFTAAEFRVVEKVKRDSSSAISCMRHGVSTPKNHTSLLCSAKLREQSQRMFFLNVTAKNSA